MICSERSPSAADVSGEIFLLLAGIKKRLGGHKMIGKVATLGERKTTVHHKDPFVLQWCVLHQMIKL